MTAWLAVTCAVELETESFAALAKKHAESAKKRAERKIPEWEKLEGSHHIRKTFVMLSEEIEAQKALIAEQAAAKELETESFAALAKEASSSLAAYQAEITALAKEVKDLKAQSAGTLGLSVPARL